ncbi:MAG TPA: D-alanine--D-alanine ligase, partial [Pirellulales bacterium]|nr:D-alanine--D-alanine ligase [Pirellulales bacterium]
LGALERSGHRAEMFDPFERPLDEMPLEQFDVCFLALHGGYGEDGRLQSELQRRGLAYTGSGPAASRLAISKSASKERFFGSGVPTLPFFRFHVTDPFEQLAASVAQLGYPVVVKPDNQGSSLGVSLATNAGELEAAVAASSRFAADILVELHVAGREFTVAVLDRRPLPLLEIVTRQPLFDYDAKYRSLETEHRFDTQLPPSKVAQLRHTAAAAAATLDTRGLVRVDLLLDSTGHPWVLEVNTLPGLSSHSLAPKAAARAGLDMADLCDWALGDALERHGRVGVTL